MHSQIRVSRRTNSTPGRPTDFPGASSRLIHLGGAFRHAAFRRLWLAESTSLLGTQVTLLALPSLAILLTGASAGEVGVLYALGYLPAVLLALPFGVAVDRTDRRRIMILADAARVLVLGTIPFAWFATGNVAMLHLYAVAISMSFAGTLYDLASQSSLPELVDKATLGDANAKLAMGQSLSQLAGAPLAGALVQVVGAALAVVTDAVSYCISALLVKSLPPWDQARSSPVECRPQWLDTAFAAFGGIRVVLGDSFLRRTVGIMAVLNLGGSMVGALFLVFTHRTLGLAPATVGVILAVGSLGAVAASVLVGRIQGALGIDQAVRVSALAASAPLWLIPGSTLGLAPIVLIVHETAFSFSATVFWVSQVTLRQLRTAGDVQGRTHAAVRVIALGTLPLGAFLGGVGASAFDVTTTVILGCTIAFTGCVVLAIRWPASPSTNQLDSRGAP